MASPGGHSPSRGCRCRFQNHLRNQQNIGKRTCKPNSVVCGHSSRRRVAANAHQRPTRRFRSCMSQLAASGRYRAATRLQPAASLPIWSCSVWGLPCLRHYCRSGALLPHLFTLTAPRPNPLDESIGLPRTAAVCSLWHWPSTGLDARVPDVIRHTALRSSDFPPPADPALAKTSGSDRPVLLPGSSVARMGVYQFRWGIRADAIDTGKDGVFAALPPGVGMRVGLAWREGAKLHLFN